VGALTPRGRPQWSKAVLRRQGRSGSTVAASLLNYRQATKQLEFLRGWLDDTDRTGRVHANYNAGKVVTGRLSCDSPNLQQVTAVLKPAYIPTPGYLVAEIDYSQIELRAAAHVADCKPMKEAFLRGDDLHAMLAAQVNGIALSMVTKEQRKVAKPGNFGLLYGMGPEGFIEYADSAYDVVYTLDEAISIHAAFFDLWKGLRAWHDRMIMEAEQTGQVVSPIGRIRRLPDIDSPIQGFASDLMQTAAASIEGNLPGYRPVPDVRLIGTVHDSILAEVPEGDWKRATARCMKRMINLSPILEQMGCKLSVPLAAEATIGTRWGIADVGIIKA
jgi:DNA polymerase-1